MRTGVLIGWKGSKPEIISAGQQIGAQNAEYKKHVLLLSEGKGSYDKVEIFVDSRNFSKRVISPKRKAEIDAAKKAAKEETAKKAAKELAAKKAAAEEAAKAAKEAEDAAKKAADEAPGIFKKIGNIFGVTYSANNG